MCHYYFDIIMIIVIIVVVIIIIIAIPVVTDLFNNTNARAMCEICSKLKIRNSGQLYPNLTFTPCSNVFYS